MERVRDAIVRSGARVGMGRDERPARASGRGLSSSRKSTNLVPVHTIGLLCQSGDLLGSSATQGPATRDLGAPYARSNRIRSDTIFSRVVDIATGCQFCLRLSMLSPETKYPRGSGRSVSPFPRRTSKPALLPRYEHASWSPLFIFPRPTAAMLPVKHCHRGDNDQRRLSVGLCPGMLLARTADPRLGTRPPFVAMGSWWSTMSLAVDFAGP